MTKIKDMVKDNKKAQFLFYRDEQLWYITDDGFEFPIPIEEAKGATFVPEFKAITLMRWIRKHLTWLDVNRIAEGQMPETD